MKRKSCTNFSLRGRAVRLLPSPQAAGLIARFTASAIALAALAGCSGHAPPAAAKPSLPSPPPQSTMQAIQNQAPPPLNLPASMPSAEKQQILAQQQKDWAIAKAAQQRMFATAAAQQRGQQARN